MNLVEKIFAAVMVAICVLLLLRMLLKPRSRERVDAAVRSGSDRWSQRMQRLVAWPAAEARARREAKDVIQRARRSSVERDGNVYRPKSFKGKRRDLH